MNNFKDLIEDYSFDENIAVLTPDRNTVIFKDSVWSSKEKFKIVDSDKEEQLRDYIKLLKNHKKLDSIDVKEGELLDLINLLKKEGILKKNNQQSKQISIIKTDLEVEFSQSYQKIEIENLEEIEENHLLLPLKSLKTKMIERVNKFCLEKNRPWTLFFGHGKNIFLITFIPNKTACAECLDHRINSNIENIANSLDTNLMESLNKIAAGFIETEMNKDYESMESAGHIIKIDAENMNVSKHKIFKVPRCSSCGTKKPFQSFQELEKSIEELRNENRN